VTSFILELLVYPPVYLLWKGKGLAGGPPTPAAAVEPDGATVQEPVPATA